MDEWLALRNQLRAKACSEGRSWFHWYRDNEPEKNDDALRDESVEVLWMAELIQHAQNYGQDLRRQMVMRLQTNASDQEARLTLRWLNGRKRPRS
jgi:hypothetical protein